MKYIDGSRPSTVLAIEDMRVGPVKRYCMYVANYC